MGFSCEDRKKVFVSYAFSWGVLGELPGQEGKKYHSRPPRRGEVTLNILNGGGS